MQNFIAMRRNELGLTQRQLAAKLCLHYQAIQRWEKSERIPSVYAAVSLAKALETTVEELFVLEGES